MRSDRVHWELDSRKLYIVFTRYENYSLFSWSEEDVTAPSVEFPNPLFLKLHPRLLEVFQEELFIFCIELNIRAHLVIPDQRHIGWQHHQFAVLCLILLRSIPLLSLMRLLLRPTFFQQQSEVLVTECRWRVRPRSPK